MKKLLSLLLSLSLLLTLAGCGDVGIIGGPDGDTQILYEGTEYVVTEETDAPVTEPYSVIAEAGWYYSAEDVALYLHTYGHLPENFITKSEARELGWEGGSVEGFKPGFAIGGDRFGNREGLLPDAPGRKYYECDIGTDGGKSRGAKRIVYSNDGLIYYTEDHYESFTLLYGEENG